MPSRLTKFIEDTIALEREWVKGNKLLFYTQKTGTAVYVPLPPAAVKALGQLAVQGFLETARAHGTLKEILIEAAAGRS